MSQILIGYVDGVPIYSDTTKTDEASASNSFLLAQILFAIQELANTQAMTVTATDASSTPSASFPTTDTTSSFPTTATGDVDDDLYTLWVMLATMQQGGASPADIQNMIEFIGSMYSLGDFEDDSLIAQFFSSSYGTTLEDALVDAVMLEYTLELMLSGSDNIAVNVASYANTLITQLEASGIPEDSEIITELTGWSNDAPYYYSETYGITYDTDEGWVLSANSMFNDSDTDIPINSDMTDSLVSQLFYSETFANEDFASCTTYLYDELLGIASSSDIWNEPTTDFELTMEYIQIQLAGLASQQTWLNEELEVVQSLIDTINSGEALSSTTTDTSGQYSKTTYTATGAFGADITITFSSESGEYSCSITTPSTEGEETATEFMTNLQNLYVDVENNPLCPDTIKTDVESAYDTIFNLPAVSSTGALTGETIGEAYADGDAETVATSLTFYEYADGSSNTDTISLSNGSDLLDSLSTLTTAFTNESSTVQALIAAEEKKYTAVMSALSYYLINTENAVDTQAVSNQT